MLDHYGKRNGRKDGAQASGLVHQGPAGSAEFRNRVNFIDDADEVLRSLGEFYAPYRHRQAA
jgi:tRNA-dihydrouridine synthase B